MIVNDVRLIEDLKALAEELKAGVEPYSNPTDYACGVVDGRNCAGAQLEELLARYQE